jgi:hypothetical protein
MSLEHLAKGAQRLLTAKLELEIANLRSQLAVAQQRITGLESEVRQRDEFRFHAPFWFRSGDPIPYCAHCWEVKHIQTHLAAPFRHTYGGVGYECHSCEKVFRVDESLPGTSLVKDPEPVSTVAVVSTRSSLREELDKFF